MWSRIKTWFQNNKSYLLSLIVLSVTAGIVAAGLCFFFPSALAAISSITIWGLAPFAFLATISLPLALITLGAAGAAITFGLSIVITAVAKQLFSIGNHIFILFNSNKNKEIIAGTSPYSNNYLQPGFNLDDAVEEYETEVSGLNYSQFKNKNDLTVPYICSEEDLVSDSLVLKNKWYK